MSDFAGDYPRKPTTGVSYPAVPSLDFNRPTSEWSDAETQWFPALVELAAAMPVRQYGVGSQAAARSNPMSLANLGFSAFMDIALRLDLSELWVFCGESRASHLLLVDAGRNNL